MTDLQDTFTSDESPIDRPKQLALFVNLDGFEGPIDLLLKLARDQKVDLTKIAILPLAEQYLSFVNNVRELDLEIAADYLVMAATETPTIRLDHVQSTPTTNPLGVRGVGEGSVLPAAPAIVGAISMIAGPLSAEQERYLYSVPLNPTAVLRVAGLR